ncbi:hypothetical protein APE_0661.1 [Aeropyrum pernix K1]|uniref:Uncharacterized protein n=1 Tax=Aeropyrum pernix (strain ATCC 700893 / DSM 11879 / JCM 9820 / NBRC 100138 / K1) TaxID=272557 RepID=Q9YEB3_AERPE|nr:hypothetical protein [Aeropyrum pernix]BAA79633.2 hypothetical protein APE_0661.1 [Aeropyrum pernix K1]
MSGEAGVRQCCLDPSTFSHREGDIARAMGLSGEDASRVRKYVEDLLKQSPPPKVSEALERIWARDCGNLSLEQRIYATFILGVSIYGSMVQEYLIRSMSSREAKGASGGRRSP